MKHADTTRSARHAQLVERAIADAASEGAPSADPRLAANASGQNATLPDAARIDLPKHRFRVLKILLALLLLGLAAGGAAYAYSRYQEEQAQLRMIEQTASFAEAFPRHIAPALQAASQAIGQADARAAEMIDEEMARRDRIVEAARKVAIDDAHAEAIAKAHQAAIDEARAAYDAEVEAIRLQRSSDFGNTIMFGDSIMQNSQGALLAEMPGVTIDAFGGRSLEEGPPGAGYDPNDGVLDHIRSEGGAFERYVIGTGNNDIGGLHLGAAEEVIAHIGPDKEIYFITEYVGGNPGGTATTNAVIADVSERYDNVFAIDWYGMVAENPGAYLRDGTHPLADAMPAYARLIRETISAYEPEPFDPDSVPFDPESVPFDPENVAFDESSVDFGPTGAVMGKSSITAATMAAAYAERGVAYPAGVYEQAGAPTVEDFAKLCIEEAEAEGVRADLLFAQAMHETAWLQFGNQVRVEQNNFGGLGALTSGGEGESFADVREGLRAQVQHLKAYASTDELRNECVDPRFDLVERGCAKTVHELGGRWAWPGDGYGDAIMATIEHLYELQDAQVASEGQEGAAEKESADG